LFAIFKTYAKEWTYTVFTLGAVFGKMIIKLDRVKDDDWVE